MSIEAGDVAYVDMSLFTESNSVGHITGDMRLNSPFRVGDLIPFGESEDNVIKEALGNVRIEHLQHHYGKPLLFLSDVYVGTKHEAFALFRYLEDFFGLFANVHDEEDLLLYLQQAGQGRDAGVCE